MEKKKIIIPITGFGKAGGHRVLSQLSNKWVEKGVEVEILVPLTSKKIYYPTNAKVIFIDKKGREQNRDKKIKEIEEMSTLSGLKALYLYLKNKKMSNEVIIANYNITAWIPFFLGLGEKTYYYIQAYEPEFYDRSIKKSFFKFLSWMTYFLPLHRVVNADIYKNYKNIKSNDVVSPGLDLKIYYPKKLTKENKKTLVVGCIGRKEEHKGAQDVGRAIEILHKKGLNIKLKVAFNPINYINHELIKPDGDERLAEYYRSLDVLVAPVQIQLGSVHYPIIEGMACGVPIISTGHYPASKDNSFLVPIKSPEEIAKKIEEIYYDYEKAYEKAMKAQEKIKEFSWEIVAQKFLNIIYNKK